MIEIRVRGKENEELKDLVKAVERNFGTKSKFRHVPHITLLGRLSTSRQKELIDTVQDVAKDYDLVSFYIDGFGEFPGRAVYARIRPSEELKEIQERLVKRLSKFCELKEHDISESYKPHATMCLDTDLPERTEIAVKEKFEEMLEFLKGWKLQDHRQHMLRVSVIDEGRRILCEYDLMLQRMLNRDEARDRSLFKETMAVFKIKRERSSTGPGKQLNFTDEGGQQGNVFVLSDLHFDHANIIKYTRRPFSSTQEMNYTMVENWNSRVKDTDRVYYLGDMTFGRDRNSIDYWLSRLNGNIRFIRGNHDTDSITKAEVIKDRFPIRYKGFEFLLMHEPYRPAYWDGWIIHGDKHNNNPVTYPHINKRNKTINICAEHTKYAPMSLDEIIKEIS